jgi:hypothetical protein
VPVACRASAPGAHEGSTDGLDRPAPAAAPNAHGALSWADAIWRQSACPNDNGRFALRMRFGLTLHPGFEVEGSRVSVAVAVPLSDGFHWVATTFACYVGVTKASQQSRLSEDGSSIEHIFDCEMLERIVASLRRRARPARAEDEWRTLTGRGRDQGGESREHGGKQQRPMLSFDVQTDVNERLKAPEICEIRAGRTLFGLAYAQFCIGSTVTVTFRGIAVCRVVRHAQATALAHCGSPVTVYRRSVRRQRSHRV